MRVIIALSLCFFSGQMFGQTAASEWLNNPEKREFFEQHGFVYQPEGKTQGLPLLEIASADALNPVEWGVLPQIEQPMQWALSCGGVVQMHSHKRLTVLYHRWLANDKKGL